MSRRRPSALAVALGLVLAALVLASLRLGSTRVVDDFGLALRGIASLCGFGSPLPGLGLPVVSSPPPLPGDSIVPVQPTSARHTIVWLIPLIAEHCGAFSTRNQRARVL